MGTPKDMGKLVRPSACLGRLDVLKQIRSEALARSSHGWFGVCAWTSQMAKIMDTILPTVSILRSWAILLGSLGGLGVYERFHVAGTDFDLSRFR